MRRRSRSCDRRKAPAHGDLHLLPWRSGRGPAAPVQIRACPRPNRAQPLVRCRSRRRVAPDSPSADVLNRTYPQTNPPVTYCAGNCIFMPTDPNWSSRMQTTSRSLDDPIRSLRDLANRWGVSLDTVRRLVAAAMMLRSQTPHPCPGTRLARVLGRMQRPAALASPSACDLGEIAIKAKQQLVEAGVGHQG